MTDVTTRPEAARTAPRRAALPGIVSAALLALALALPQGAGAASRPEPLPMSLGALVPPPAGASRLCRDLPWACDRTTGRALSAAQVLDLAQDVNRRINRRYANVSDRRLHGREDHWTELGPRGGDCEDFALTKMRALQRWGIASEALRIATVLDRDRQPHAVLLVTVGEEDVVLDNLTDRILPWHATGYVFLRVQDREDRSSWRMVDGAYSLASL